MTDDEQDHAAREVITAYLTRELDAATEKERQAKKRLELWQTDYRLDNAMALAVARAVIEEVEDAERLVNYAETPGDVDLLLNAKAKAYVTRQWLREHGYNIPDSPRFPGL